MTTLRDEAEAWSKKRWPDLITSLSTREFIKEVATEAYESALSGPTVMALVEALVLISKMRDGDKKNGPWTIAQLALKQFEIRNHHLFEEARK